ncbi:zf-TFIIB domain-containing protein [Leptospira vanthielii]|nr:zf-TFIIB domain-containing protein [Leptospira vanthielii]
MKNCPKCKLNLAPLKTNFGKIIICNKCFGHYYSEKTLELLFTNSSWELTKNKSKIKESKISCPECENRMSLLKLSSEYNFVEIDLCSDCKILWLDKDEIEQLNLNHISAKNYPTIYKKNQKKIESEINYLLRLTKLDANLSELKCKKELNNFATQYSPISFSNNRSVFNAFDLITFFKTFFRKKD